jgi:hypothetical protein
VQLVSKRTRFAQSNAPSRNPVLATQIQLLSLPTEKVVSAAVRINGAEVTAAFALHTSTKRMIATVALPDFIQKPSQTAREIAPLLIATITRFRSQVTHFQAASAAVEILGTERPAINAIIVTSHLIQIAANVKLDSQARQRTVIDLAKLNSIVRQTQKE